MHVLGGRALLLWDVGRRKNMPWGRRFVSPLGVSWNKKMRIFPSSLSVSLNCLFRTPKFSFCPWPASYKLIPELGPPRVVKPLLDIQHLTPACCWHKVVYLTCCTIYPMCPPSTLTTSNALHNVHGVHMVSHSPFVLEEVGQHGDLYQETRKSSVLGLNHRQLAQRVWQQRPSCLKPIHCSIRGDLHFAETVANVLTSLPFIALGIHAPRKNLNTKLYANSLVGVGVASAMYHSSRGKLRRFLRWVDYTMIATATVCLSRAIRNENPKVLMAASALILPVQPLMVSAVHTGLMEVSFAKKALEDPGLRMAHTMHKMSSLLGGALFIADDMFPRTPYLHAAWHLAAAVGVGTCNKLLE